MAQSQKEDLIVQLKECKRLRYIYSMMSLLSVAIPDDPSHLQILVFFSLLCA